MVLFVRSKTEFKKRGVFMALYYLSRCGGTRVKCVRHILLATVISCSSQSHCLAAGTGSKEGQQLEEIIVTAQKRTEKLQNVPISISVLGGIDLDKSPAQGVTEELIRAPGVTAVAAQQGGGTQVAIRGVTASGPIGNGSSPIGYYLDAVPFGLTAAAIAPNPQAYDLERVEVLRGPQGTLYGASSVGGLVRVLTNDANLDKLELKARSAISDTEDGGTNYRGDLAVNVPIIEGKLAARAVVGYQNLSGWLGNAVEDHTNDAELRNYRLKINAQPTEELSLGLTAWIERDDFGAPSRAADNGRTTGSLPEPMVTDYDIFSFKAAYDFTKFTVSSVSSYIDFTNDGWLDFNAAGLPGNLLATLNNSKIFSQEIVLTSATRNSWKWTVGGLYRDADERGGQDLTPLFPVPFVRGKSTAESYAAFGEVGRRFFHDRFEWTLGLRYFSEDRSGAGSFFGGPVLPFDTAKGSFHSTSPRAVLTWYPSSTVTAYGSYSEGFRSGDPASPRFRQDNPGIPLLKPDTLHNYEVGAKATLLEGRISLDSAIYYMDYQDIQQNLQVPIVAGSDIFVNTRINGSSASGVGVDLSVAVRPADGFQIGLSVGWNDLSMDSTVFSGGLVLFDKGDRLNFSAEYTGSAFADYSFPLGGSEFQGIISASINHSSEQDYHGQRATIYFLKGDPLTNARVSFAVAAPEHWTVNLFVDNATNEQGAVPTVDPIPEWFTRVRPRTVGLQFDYQY